MPRCDIQNSERRNGLAQAWFRLPSPMDQMQDLLQPLSRPASLIFPMAEGAVDLLRGR
jgi:hypothetical protein